MLNKTHSIAITNTIILNTNKDYTLYKKCKCLEKNKALAANTFDENMKTIDTNFVQLVAALCVSYRGSSLSV